MENLMKRLFLILLLASTLPLYSSYDSKIDFYGFIRGEVLFENRINKYITGDQPDIFPRGVPYDDEKKFIHSESIWDARNSRLGVIASDKYCNCDMKAVIEGDFETEDGNGIVTNSRHFRIRHAYARGDHSSGFLLLVGQYWSLIHYNPEIPSPDFVSNTTPVGAAFSRQPQFRIGYKHHVKQLKGDIQLEVDVEKHAFNDVTPPLAPNIESQQGCFQHLPIFITKLSWLQENFKSHIAAAGAQSITIFDDIAGKATDQGVWIVEACASYRWKNFLLWGTVHHTHGLNRFFSGNFIDMTISPSGHLYPVTSNGGCVGLRWDWIKDILWFDVLYGWDVAQKINKTGFNGDFQKSYEDIHVNAFYNFWKHWQLELEYQRVNVRAFNHQKGHTDGIRFAVLYFFGEAGAILQKG